MKIRCLYDKLVPVSQLKAHPRNRNRHPQDQIARLAQILEYQGFRYPIKVSRLSGFITSGHGRLMAAQHLGVKEVPVNFQEYESEEQEYADLQADNAIALWAELDTMAIIGDLDDFPDLSQDLLGLKSPLDIDVLEPQDDPDEVPETPVEPKTKPGDLYVLGKHRLLCGDSTNIQNVERLMDGEKADMVFTDPPYGMSLDADFSKMGNASIKPGRKHEGVIGDNEDFDPGMIFGFFGDVPEIVLFGADYYADKIPDRNAGSWLVWDKRVEDRFDEVIGSAFEMIWSKKRRKREILRHEYVSWKSRMADTVNGTKPHPTMKPVEMLLMLLEKIEARAVVDLFGGSGSTLIACEKTKRRCFMMELDPKYCDVIVARWEKFTSQKAELTHD